MGIWDRLTGNMAPTYDESALEGAGAIASWQGSILRGPFATYGGRLVLTEKALLFSPLDLKGTIQAIKIVLEAVELPGEQVITQIVDSAQKAPLSIALNNIGSLEQTGAARLLTPPSAQLITRVGSVHNFGVLAGIGFPNKSKENDVAMADFLQQVRSRVPATV